MEANLSALMIESGQFLAVYFIFFGTKYENQEDDFT